MLVYKRELDWKLREKKVEHFQEKSGGIPRSVKNSEKNVDNSEKKVYNSEKKLTIPRKKLTIPGKKLRIPRKN